MKANVGLYIAEQDLTMTATASLPDWNDLRLGIIGLGYVGLPLAVEFGKRFPTIGYDLKPERIAELYAKGATRKNEFCSRNQSLEKDELKGR